MLMSNVQVYNGVRMVLIFYLPSGVENNVHVYNVIMQCKTTLSSSPQSL